MKITSAQFVKGIVGPDQALEKNFPQVAFIGRSNAGKSTLINSLTGMGRLARTSNRPGQTREINLYLINEAIYFIDLPGYGYASASHSSRLELGKIINGYLFQSEYRQKSIVIVIDANVGPTALDLEMIRLLEEHQKNIIVAANKIDKVKRSVYAKQMALIREKVGDHLVLPYSSKKKIGRKELLREII